MVGFCYKSLHWRSLRPLKFHAVRQWPPALNDDFVRDISWIKVNQLLNIRPKVESYFVPILVNDKTCMCVWTGSCQVPGSSCSAFNFTRKLTETGKCYSLRPNNGIVVFCVSFSATDCARDFAGLEPSLIEIITILGSYVIPTLWEIRESSNPALLQCIDLFLLPTAFLFWPSAMCKPNITHVSKNVHRTLCKNNASQLQCSRVYAVYA